MDKITKINVNGVDYELAGSGVDVVPQEITYDNLVELQNSGSLVPGNKYRIIDFVTETTWEGEKPTNVNLSAKHPFDLIVTAKDTSSLYKEASAALHEGDEYFAKNDLSKWKLKYSLTSTHYVKGQITDMIDEFNNHALFDFKNELKSTVDFPDTSLYAFSYVEMSGSSVSKVEDSSLSGKVINNEMIVHSVIVDVAGMLKNKGFIEDNKFLYASEISLKSKIQLNSFKNNEMYNSLKIHYTKGKNGGISKFENCKISTSTELLCFNEENPSFISFAEFGVYGLSSFKVKLPQNLDNCIFLGKFNGTAYCEISSEIHSNIVAISDTTYKLII